MGYYIGLGNIFPFLTLSFRRTSLTRSAEQGAVLYQGVNHARLLPAHSSRM